MDVNATSINQNKPHTHETTSQAPLAGNKRPVIGHLPELKRDFFSAMCRWQRNYGDIVRFYLGRRQVYLLSHPRYAEEVLIKQKDNFGKVYNPEKPRGLALILGNGLVTSKGAIWKKQRRLIQPVFHRSTLSDMDVVMTQAGEMMLQQWQALAKDDVVDISSEMTRLTLEVITQTMFSTSVSDRASQLAPALETVLSYSQTNLFNPLSIPLFIPTPTNIRFNKANHYLRSLIRGIIESRTHEPNQHHDLLDLLLNAKDAETGEKMELQQIIDECLTIFTAGHETTANALAWTWYLLSQHKDIQQQAQKEVDDVLKGKVPRMADLADMPLSRAVIEESIRLYPPAVALIRMANRDTMFDGYRIDKGSLVIVNIYNIHHHHELWGEVDAFNPSRFLTQNRESIKRLSYMPFGAGERVCIGNHFAMAEAQLLLTQMLQKFTMEFAGENPVEEKLAVTLRPKNGLPMRIIPR